MRENGKLWSVVSHVGATVTATLALSLVLGATPASAYRINDSATKPAAGASVSPAAVRIAAGSRTTARWSGSINIRSRDAVNAAYWEQYASKLSLRINWLGGSVLGCLPGLTTWSTNHDTMVALNFVRSLAGLAPVRFSNAMNAAAQQTALLMDANNALDHNPSSSWKCWNPTAARTASRSNLAMAWPTLKSGQIIDLYMDDRGSSNQAVGHRRWILNPFSTVMGIGSTSTANALTVIGPTRSTRPNPRYVSWPTTGYFPSPLEPAGRWSLSAGLKSVNFSKARVRVYRNGVRVAVRKYPVHTGYAQPTLVWQLAAGTPKVGTFKVVVTNIHRKGIRRALSYTYRTHLFRPSK